MPYIRERDRPDIDIDNWDWTKKPIGALNYILTFIMLDCIKVRGQSYATYNEVLGVLECMKQELYRRMVAPYEDAKREENGDVGFDAFGSPPGRAE